MFMTLQIVPDVSGTCWCYNTNLNYDIFPWKKKYRPLCEVSINLNLHSGILPLATETGRINGLPEEKQLACYVIYRWNSRQHPFHVLRTKKLYPTFNGGIGGGVIYIYIISSSNLPLSVCLFIVSWQLLYWHIIVIVIENYTHLFTHY